MKKNYFSFIFAFIMLVPCMLLLTACGGKKVSSITIDNMFVGERQVEYQYGTSINDIISTNLTVTVNYDDNSKKVLEPNEYVVKYYKDSVEVDNFKAIPDVGNYSIEVIYDTSTEINTFTVVPSYKSPYEITLTKNTWAYCNDLPEISLSNYVLKEGETVDWFYIEKNAFENLTEEQKTKVEEYASRWINSSMYVYAGEYYVFGKINFIEQSNYTGVTKIDNNCLITVTKQTITLSQNLVNDYNFIAEYTFAEDTVNINLGDIDIIGDVIYLEPIGDAPIQGTLQWLNPDQVITIDNNSQSFPVKFIPFFEEDNLNYNFEGNLTLQVNIKKDILNVSGDYQSVNPTEDGNLEPMPKYMEYLGKWMEVGMETTAPDYDAQIQIDYKDQNQTLKMTGNLNNNYTDVSTYNSFTTNTTLTDGKDNYVINGKVDTSGLNNKYTVTKNGEETNFVIDATLHSLIMTALRIDLANNSISGETLIYSVAQDSENLKIKIESNFEGGVIVVHFVFDVEGNFVGHKVSMTSVDGTMSYSIQMKLVKLN